MVKTWSQELSLLEKEGMLRSLRVVDGSRGSIATINGEDVLLLCSNNYLGIANHPLLKEAMISATRKFGAGTGASRLISGTSPLHTSLEERIAEFKGTEAALVFNSGYAANTGILQSLFGPEDVIFSDALNHASIIDGCKLSGASIKVYPHCDTQRLEELMNAEKQTRKGRWLIVTDGVFSMDGDIAPLRELCRIKEQYDAFLMVDDAHGTGVLGNKGRGTGELLGCLERIDLHMGTLGKALGCAGAYVAADRTIIQTLINRSRPFIFSTSLPPGIPAAAIAAFDIIDSDEGCELRTRLQKNRKYFASMLSEAGLNLLGSTTQIIPVLTKDPVLTMNLTQSLMNRGVFLQGIRPPTVGHNLCRLRATVMASHRISDLNNAAISILDVFKDHTH